MKKQQLSKKHQSAKRGQALVEFALVIPIVLFFMMAIIDLGYAVISYSQLTDATRVAVRHGMTKGIDGGIQYLDCDGIAGAVEDLPGVANLSNATVTITYKDSAGTDIGSCVGSVAQDAGGNALTPASFGNGGVLEVTVQGDLSPITPFFADLFTVSLSRTSERTIITQGAAAIDNWPGPPPDPPSDFSVACGDYDSASGLFDAHFSWTWPAGQTIEPNTIYEILNVADDNSLVTVVPDADVLAGSITVPAILEEYVDEDTLGLFYIRAVSGTAPNTLVGDPSSIAHPSPPCATYAISGFVYLDEDSSGGYIKQDDSLALGVSVTLECTGGDCTVGWTDTTTTSVDDGTFSFSVIDDGTYELSATSGGYSGSMAVTVAGGDVTDIEFGLTSSSP
jgi:Flp pilus assembly protein TadG